MISRFFAFRGFLSPENFDAKKLSTNRLFDRRKRNNSKVNWFVLRFEHEQEKLSRYRHPLVYYKEDNGFLKRSYSASRSRIWLQNAMDGLEANETGKGHR